MFIASSDPMFSGALVAALSATPDIEMATIVDADRLTTDGLEGENVVVVLHGADAMAAVGQMGHMAPVLILGSGDPAQMLEAVDAGAMGYLDDSSPLETIRDAVRSLGKGVATIDEALLGSLLRHVVERRRAEARERRALDVLTPREDEVFRLLARGLDNNDVAEELFISLQTVRTHTRRVMEKLDLHSRSELVAFAARCGLNIDPRGNSND